MTGPNALVTTNKHKTMHFRHTPMNRMWRTGAQLMKGCGGCLKANQPFAAAVSGNFNAVVVNLQLRWMSDTRKKIETRVV